MPPNNSRPSYGIDAPTIVRNLAIASVLLLALRYFAAPRFGWLAPFAPSMLIGGVATGAMALWMLASSLFLKQRTLAKLLAAHVWRGDETVLDVGCGRGLLTITVANKLPHGRVVAIDLWRAEDLSNNSPETITANIRAAHLADRITVETGDARALPFPAASFDVVGSMTVIHNIPDRQGREAAISEMWRVLKPGGDLLIYDIRHTRSYARQLRSLGAEQISLSWPIFLWGVIGWRLSARK
jgi:arsenite methyltransferase